MTCRAAFATGNWRRFFAIVDEASYEHACCLERHFAVARIDALRSLNCALNSTPMKLDELARVLRLDSASDAETYVKACGLTVSVDESAERTVRVPNIAVHASESVASRRRRRITRGEPWIQIEFTRRARHRSRRRERRRRRSFSILIARPLTTL